VNARKEEEVSLGERIILAFKSHGLSLPSNMVAELHHSCVTFGHCNWLCMLYFWDIGHGEFSSSL